MALAASGTSRRDTQDLIPMFELVLEEGANLLSADRASLFVHDEPGESLFTVVALGEQEPIRVKVGEGIVGLTFTSRKVVNVPDAYAHPHFNPLIDRQTGYRTHSVLSVPVLSSDGTPLAVLQVLNRRDGAPFGRADEEAAQTLTRFIAVAIEHARLSGRLQSENQSLREDMRRLVLDTGIVGTSPAIQDVLSVVRRVSTTSYSVLITGESGTGKELIARAIHYSSERTGPLVVLNCAALPESLLESELFGIEKGVATGVEPRPGKFEIAHRGTLFLDEVADMSHASQAKVLRVLQDGLVERVGSAKPRPVDVRLLAATNREVAAEVAAGRLREDLYYRLGVVQIHLPPLRERREDIPLLAQHFLRRAATEVGRRSLRLSPAAMAALTSHGWPGNVRELENEIRRAAALAPRPLIDVADLSPHVLRPAGPAAPAAPLVEPATPPASDSLKDRVAGLERTMIVEVMRKVGGNKTRAAHLLGLSRAGLMKKLHRYSLEA